MKDLPIMDVWCCSYWDYIMFCSAILCVLRFWCTNADLLTFLLFHYVYWIFKEFYKLSKKSLIKKCGFYSKLFEFINFIRWWICWLRLLLFHIFTPLLLLIVIMTTNDNYLLSLVYFLLSLQSSIINTCTSFFIIVNVFVDGSAM